MIKGVVTSDSSNTTLSSGQLEYHLDGASPQACVAAAHSPSVHVYFALRSQLERCGATWLQDFVSFGGLDSLLDALYQMTGKTFSTMCDAILQIDCISCIRAVLNSSQGIDYIVQNPAAANKLVMGLEVINTLPKKQMLEILSALCAHSHHSYNCVLEGLDNLKRETDQYHRFSMVVNELKKAETVPYKTAVMTFINALINCNPDLPQRCRIRSQMIGLTLLDVISFLQREDSDDDLHIQIQVFHDQKHLDEEHHSSRADVDLSSPSELVEALQSRVFGTSRMAAMVNILQDLLAIEVLDKGDKERLWEIVEQQVHHLVHCSSSRLKATTLASLTPVQIDHLLVQEIKVTESLVSKVSESKQNVTTDNNHTLYDNFSNRDKSQYVKGNPRPKTPEPDLLEDLNDLNSSSPSIPKMKLRFKLPALPDLPEMNMQQSRPSLPLMSAPVFPTTTFDYVATRRGSLDGLSYQKGSSQFTFRTLAVPLPSHTMKNFKWVKIQDSVVESSRGCVWEPREVIPRIEPDYSRLESLFYESHILEVHDEVPLLAGEVRLKINLFLNRLEVEPDELVRKLIDCDSPSLTLPLLKYLNDIMPCSDEMLMLKQFNGNLLDIGMAEQFLLHLMDIPDNHILLTGQLTRLHFTANMRGLHTALTHMVSACRLLLESRSLRDWLHLVLRVGNFLNHGQFNGNARGLKLSSLKRLKDMNSAEPNHTLLHQLVAIVDETDDRMFRLLAEIPRLEEATKYSPEEIRSEVNSLNCQLKNFVGQLKLAHPNITAIFHAFLEGVKKDLVGMQQSIAELRELTKQVSAYLCEPMPGFSLQACFTDILTFLKDVRTARQDNTLFRRQRSQARRRSDQFRAKLKNKKIALQFGKEAGASSSMLEDRKKVLERILAELHHGNFQPLVPSSGLSTPESEEAPPVPGDDEDNKKLTTTPHPGLGPKVNPQTQMMPAPVPPGSVKLTETSPDPRKLTLELSRISVEGTPMINRPSSENLDDIFHLTPKAPVGKRIITSSAKNLVDAPSEFFVKPKQSQLPPPPLPPPPTQQEQHPKACHPRVAQLSTISPRTTTTTHHSHHHRSKSDLTDSFLVQNKWLMYEAMKEREMRIQDPQNAPLAVPESSTTLATLNLEHAWACPGLEGDHLMRLRAGPVVYEPDMQTKKEKKGGIGAFFSRFTRAVLGSRSSAANVERNILRPSQIQEKRRGRQSSYPSDKENEAFQTGDVKRSSKRMGRFCSPKYSN